MSGLISNQEEYTLSNGETVSIQFSGKLWEVACWDKKDNCRWYKEFESADTARKEFERWRDVCGPTK